MDQTMKDDVTVEPITLGGLAGLLDAVPGATGRPPVAALPELAARLIGGCTAMSFDDALALPARDAIALAEECLKASDLSSLVAVARRAVRLATAQLAGAHERGPR